MNIPVPFTKDEFLKYIEPIQTHREREDLFCDVLDKLSPVSAKTYPSKTFIYADYEDAYFYILLKLLNLSKSKEDNFIKFCNDYEFGDNYQKDAPKYFKSVDAFYAYLVSKWDND